VSGDLLISGSLYDRRPESSSPVQVKFVSRISGADAPHEDLVNPTARTALGPLALVGAASLALAIAGPLVERPQLVLGLYLLAGVGWWWSIQRARRNGIPLRLVVVGAIVLRVLALASDLRSSDDVQRIAWEGAVVLEGLSPYAHTPDAPDVAALAARNPRLYGSVNHRDVAAAYPPLVQAVGVLTALTLRGRDEPELAGRIVRAAFGLADLLVLVPLVFLLRRRGLPDGLAVVWGWSPLAAFEIAGSGHLEALALAPLLGAWAWSERARSRADHAGAAGLFALAVLAKLLPIVLLPWFLRGPRAVLRAAVVLAVVALGFAPFLVPAFGLSGTERGVLGGVSEYAFRWENSGLVHRFVEGAFALRWSPDLSWTDPRRLARAVLALLWLAWAWRTWRREKDPVRAALDLFGAWIVVTPVLHPWYALWIVPWLAFRDSRAFTWFACAAPLLFVPVVGWQSHGTWVEPAWIWPALALPLALGLALDAWRMHPRATPT